MKNFTPPNFLKNPHTQTILGASALRRFFVKKRAQELLSHTQSLILRCNDGVRLQAEFTKNPQHNGYLAVMLHGWEGSAHSAYLIGCGQQFYALGYHVARLNLRDHGDTHHLNQSPFNSVRLDEVSDAILDLSLRYPNKGIVLLGFSLGGNFVLRLSGLSQLASQLKQSITICPAIDPHYTSQTLEKGNPFYHYHFLKKWRDSLKKKYRYYPEIMGNANDLTVKKLHQMNQHFVPKHTEYETPEAYLTAYKITQATLNAISVPCDIIYSDDDPIINADSYDELSETANVKLHLQSYGGHCAFSENIFFHSWIDSILPELLLP